MTDNVHTSHSSISMTPLDVRPRRMRFPYSEMESKFFFDDNPLKSAFVASLSAKFPAGEGEFIKSVRFFQKNVKDPEMQAQIRGFIGQEAHHSKQHQDFNRELKHLGFDAERVERVFEKDLAWSIRKAKPKHRLAFTVSFEHLTAILAHEFLTNPERLSGMDPAITQLLKWHAIEEIEHKSVAFDLYMDQVSDRRLLHWSLRFGLLLFFYRTHKYMFLMLKWSRTMPKWRHVKSYCSYLFGKKGLFRTLKRDFKDYFRADFHPWDHDNRELVEEWKEAIYDAQYDEGKKKVA